MRVLRAEVLSCMRLVPRTVQEGSTASVVTIHEKDAQGQAPHERDIIRRVRVWYESDLNYRIETLQPPLYELVEVRHNGRDISALNGEWPHPKPDSSTDDSGPYDIPLPIVALTDPERLMSGYVQVGLPTAGRWISGNIVEMALSFKERAVDRQASPLHGSRVVVSLDEAKEHIMYWIEQQEHGAVIFNIIVSREIVDVDPDFPWASIPHPVPQGQ